MAKALKQMMVAEYERTLHGVGGVIILDPGPMTVETSREFRRDLREKAGGARMELVQNRIARIAIERTFCTSGAKPLADALKGPSAVVFGGDGPVPIAKVLREWRRKFRPLKIKLGVSEGEILDAEAVDGLADLPGMPQLRAMLLSTVMGPARGIAGALQAVYGGIVRALQARVDQQTDDAVPPEGEGGDGGPSGA